MIEYLSQGAWLHHGTRLYSASEAAQAGFPSIPEGRTKTIAWSILQAHNLSQDPGRLALRFDALASHDITYVGIIQTARASGMERFPLPYVLTNCHNSLGAVGGTINEDDHAFGLTAAKKYGGIYVPPHLAVIHQYMREAMAGCGKMILGSDSHTRYGALGTMAVGEGGPELAKQLLGKTWDSSWPEVVGIWLEGSPVPGVGPQDVALALISQVFAQGLVKNKVLEFIGPGLGGLTVDYRNGIDVMTTETTCLSSIWETDGQVEAWLGAHGRPQDYQKLQPGAMTWYDQVIKIDLGKIRPMMALPFHPSNGVAIADFLDDPGTFIARVEEEMAGLFPEGSQTLDLGSKLEKGGYRVDQGVIAGCAGGSFENIMAAADILRGQTPGSGLFSLSIYPSSQPVYLELMRQGAIPALMESGAIIRSAFCGPCFGAGDVPFHQGLSVRHTTRNFPSREGSKPAEGQVAGVALMDARSIAATAAAGGLLTPATSLAWKEPPVAYTYNDRVYQNRVGNHLGKAVDNAQLKYGPNIKDWPEMVELPPHLVLVFASVIPDPVTTTDELIPSGETSSYRSNPERLSQFTLSRKDPAYVGRALALRKLEYARRQATSGGQDLETSGWLPETLAQAVARAQGFGLLPLGAELPRTTGIGSVVFAVKPGDGSAREQAASCQKVLGGWANLACEYATKRYRSNLVNWGMLPFVIQGLKLENGTAVDLPFAPGDVLVVPGIRQVVESGGEVVKARLYTPSGEQDLELALPALAEGERQTILAGCLMNQSRLELTAKP